MATTKKTTSKKVNYTYNPKKESATQYNARIASERGDTAKELKSMQKVTEKTFKEKGLDVNKINSASLTPANSFIAPEQPTQEDPGDLAGAGNVGAATGLDGYTLNEKGLFEKAQIAQSDIMKYALDNQPKMPSLEKQYYKSQEYKDVNRAQQDVNAYTAQLNQITARSQAQQLALEGQGRGQTESFLGGEQARINREAAIAALPVQAQLAAAQGNLEFAQKQLDTVFTLRSQDAQNKYKYETDRLNSILGFLDKAETRQYNEKMTLNEREYNKTQNNINYLRQLTAQARENGNTSVIGQLGSIDPASPTFEQDVAKVSSQIVDRNAALQRELLGVNIAKGRAELATQQAKQKQIEDAIASGQVQLDPDQQKTAMSLGKQFEDESKDFKTRVSAYNQVVASAKDPSAAGDLSLLFGYMKMLDPNSVVRETEFANAENAGGVPERIRAQWNKVLNGQRLESSMRKDFVDRAGSLYNSALEQQMDLEDTFAAQGTDVYGLPSKAVDLIIRDIRAEGSVSDVVLGMTLNSLSNEQLLDLRNSGLLTTPSGI